MYKEAHEMVWVEMKKMPQRDRVLQWMLKDIPFGLRVWRIWVEKTTIRLHLSPFLVGRTAKETTRRRRRRRRLLSQ